jgi:hypothetical protein
MPGSPTSVGTPYGATPGSVTSSGYLSGTTSNTGTFGGLTTNQLLSGGALAAGGAGAAYLLSQGPALRTRPARSRARARP